MAVIRVNKSRNYTVMSNEHFREKNMSLKAKGLLSLMLSLPDDWDYSISGLVSICKENETAIKSTLDELKTFGYLNVTKLMPNETQSGRIEYNYDVYETPQHTEKQEVEKQGVENQPLEIQPVENQGQLNTNTSNTKKSNTKNRNNNRHTLAVREIVEYLNQKAGTQFRSGSKATQQHINARLAEGYTVEDFKTVIDKKCADWKGTDYEQYLRPSTLFGVKFENYLNAAKSTRTNQQQNGQKFTFTNKYDV